MQSPWALPLVILLALAALVPQGHAADIPAPPAGPLVEDIAGDVQATESGPALPSQAYGGLDLRALAVSEDKDNFHFVVQVNDVKTGQDGVGGDGDIVYVQFAYSGRTFLIGIIHYDYPGIGEGANAWLDYTDDAGATWNQEWFHAHGATLDATANTYSVDIARGDLADASGSAPFPGRSFDSFQVFSHNALGDGNFLCCPFGLRVNPPAKIQDAMPDAGVAPTAYPIQIGARQTGHAFLSSLEPFRSSNGEATTFLFKASGKNTGGAADRFNLQVTSVPKDWSVSLPVTTLSLEAGVDAEFPVLVTVPFSHIHGSVLSFVVEMTSASDPGSVGRIEMGVRYLAIPQPAGHHNTLHFHSYSYGQFAKALSPAFTGNDGYAYMNTLDAVDGDMPLTPPSVDTYTKDSKPYERYSWCLRLNPGLEMGLDFVTAQVANLSVGLHASAPLQGAILTASLTLQGAGASDQGPYACYSDPKPVPLATLAPTTPQDVAANTDAVLEGALAMLPAADRVPYAKGQSLLLQINVEAISVPNFFNGADAPTLLPGGYITLPLVEYHDSVAGVLTIAAGPPITALGPQERRANPGATVVFPLSIANEASDGRHIVLNVTGTNLAWVDPVAAADVPSHDTARAQVVVHVAKDAKPGETADLIVQAYDSQAPAARSLIRLLVVTDTVAGLPDDAALVVPADSGHKSPSVAPAAAVTLLALLALARRRPTL